MNFTHFYSFFLFFLTFGLIASAAPAVDKRSNADIENVLNDLKSKTDSILPQISMLT